MKMLGKQLAALGLAGLLAFGAPASAVLAAENGTKTGVAAAEITEEIIGQETETNDATEAVVEEVVSEEVKTTSASDFATQVLSNGTIEITQRAR